MQKKPRRKKLKRTHRLCAIQKRIAHDIYVARHRTLPNKAIKAISIDYPRKMRRVNRNARSSGILVQRISVKYHNVQKCKNAKMQKKKNVVMEKMGRKEQYLYSKGGHEVSAVELIIVQLCPKSVDISHIGTS